MKVKLNDYLAQINGARIISLRTKTQEKLLAASRAEFPDGISKICRTVGMLGVNYENAANNILAKEFLGDDISELPHFTPEAQWKGAGERVNKFFIRHKVSGELYLKFMPKLVNGFEQQTDKIYIDNATGLEVTKEAFEKYKGKQSPRSPGKPCWRTITAANILGIGDTDIEFDRENVIAD